MKRNSHLLLLLFLTLIFFSCSDSNIPSDMKTKLQQPYPEEIQAKIGRGLIAFAKEGKGVFLSWRLLPNERIGTTFIIKRGFGETNDANKLQKIAETELNSYLDKDIENGQKYTYSIQPAIDGKSDAPSEMIVAINSKTEKDRIEFDLGEQYQQARVVTGDLTGNGELETVIAYSQNRKIDPYQDAWQKSEHTIKVAAFLRSGERLWNIDLGRGIEAGSAYSPIVVWDIDSDGCAEVILKTNTSKDPLDYANEHLTILDGKTGKKKNEAKWPRTVGNDYNSNSRNYIAIAHLDGINPYIIAGRGLYHTQVIWAYDVELNRKWERVLGLDFYWPKGVIKKVKKLLAYDDTFDRIMAKAIKKTLKDEKSRGSHGLPIADVNDDGKEEILWGEHCIGQDGKDLWEIGEKMPYNGHPDIVFAAEIISSIPGKEIFYCREGWKGKDDKIGMLLVNSRGETIWGKWGYTHIDGGWVSKIVPGQEGKQCYGFDILEKNWNKKGVKIKEITNYLWNSKGEQISNPPDSWTYSLPVDWDGDGIREICSKDGDIMTSTGVVVEKIDSGVLWGADLFGDQREEIVVAQPGSRKVYIFFNTTVIDSQPSITKLADRQYRNDLSRTAMQTNLIPTECGYIPQRVDREGS